MADDESNVALPRLIADIGGTNARFALVDATGTVLPSSIQVLACADYADLAAAAEAYLSRLTDTPRPRQAIIDVATFVDSDRVQMTNRAWSFSVTDTCHQLGLKRLQCVNDFTARALALPSLSASDVSHSITSTVLWTTLFVLVVHFAIALVEF